MLILTEQTQVGKTLGARESVLLNARMKLSSPPELVSVHPLGAYKITLINSPTKFVAILYAYVPYEKPLVLPHLLRWL